MKKITDIKSAGMLKDPLIRELLTKYAANFCPFLIFDRSAWDFIYSLMSNESIQLMVKFARSGGKRAHIAVESNEDEDDQIWAIWRRSSAQRATAIQCELGCLLRRQVDAQVPVAQPRFAELQTAFGLTNLETDILRFLYCTQFHEPLRQVMSEYPVPQAMSVLACAISATVAEVGKALGEKGPLPLLGLVDQDDDMPGPIGMRTLDHQISLFLVGVEEKPLAARYYRKYEGTAYPVASFPVRERAKAAVLALLRAKQGCHILLYGQAGAGKTEFARAIAAEAGLAAYFCEFGVERKYSTNDARFKVVKLAATLMAHTPGVLIIDEADTLLNTGYFKFEGKKECEKGQLHAFFDQVCIPIIWITNDISYMEESSLRRFAYAVEFKSFTLAQREACWRRLTKTHPLHRYISEALIKKLSAACYANASGIAAALNTLTKLVPADQANAGQVQAVLLDLLKQHAQVTGHRPPGGLNDLSEHYDSKALNTDISPQLIMTTLKNYLDVTSVPKAGQRRGNINLLFWGRPGTGKTEFAKYLARELSRRLCLKRMSDLQSKWIGMTEKNIRAAFEEAERDQAILFLDEADSFFINRETAFRSWETSQTNELLTQMENYKGILICCTNMLTHLDPAVLRRFAWKVEFRPLTDVGKICVYAQYFSDNHDCADIDVNRLTGIRDLTVGDVRTVWQKFQYLPAEQKNNDLLLQALEKEAEYKTGRTGKIGFAGCPDALPEGGMPDLAASALPDSGRRAPTPAPNDEISKQDEDA